MFDLFRYPLKAVASLIPIIFSEPVCIQYITRTEHRERERERDI